MKDPTTVKHALLQVIMAMKDATSLPWPAVGGAWATSMHDLEEGHLGWQDATQWSINRLSASRISMASAQNPQTTQPRKLCKFYNEGTCSHEASHENYKHAYFEKQDRSGGHPEVKCFTKLRAKKGCHRPRANNHLDSHHTLGWSQGGQELGKGG